MNIHQKITTYLHYCEYQKKLSANSIKAYSIDLKQFMYHLNAMPGQSLTKQTISEYVMKLHQLYPARTAKRKLASLRAFLNYLEFEEMLDDNPIRKIKTKFQEPKVLPKVIPLKFIEQLLAIAHQEKKLAKTTYRSFSALRDIAILETLFATGMRVSELCSIKTGDINLDDGTIHVMGKGGKERIIQIGNSEVLANLQQYRNANTYKSNFFINRLSSRLSEQSVRFMIRKFRKKAEISLHITPHMFRHSFATLLLEEDVDIRYIQRMLGHSSIQTTQIYTQVTTEKQRQILATKHPRNRIRLY
jgi:integrase/recombinase XerD